MRSAYLCFWISLYSVIIALDITCCAGGSACCCCLLGQFISRPIIRRCSPGNHWVPKILRERWATLLAAHTAKQTYQYLVYRFHSCFTVYLASHSTFYNPIIRIVIENLFILLPRCQYLGRRVSSAFTYLCTAIYPKVEKEQFRGENFQKSVIFITPNHSHKSKTFPTVQKTNATRESSISITIFSSFICILLSSLLQVSYTSIPIYIWSYGSLTHAILIFVYIISAPLAALYLLAGCCKRMRDSVFAVLLVLPFQLFL